MRIGKVSIDPPLFLAPMAGVTDRDFRLLIRRMGGVGLVAMEFISSRALVEGPKKVRELMVYKEEERPLAIQIYGSTVATMAKAAEIVEGLGADICDINMGCPANKVLKGCAGAALMRDLPLAQQIIREVKRRLSIPLTVKFRLGVNQKSQNFIDLGRICEDEGVAAVAMHARTAKQMYSGEACWEDIARLKDALEIPVIGNGDVREPADALKMIEETGCDGVMIGRGALKNPWIFRQIAALMDGEEFSEPSLDDRHRLIRDHFGWVAERESSHFALHKLRKFTGWYTHGLPYGRRLRRQIQHLASVDCFLQAVDEFFAEIKAEMV